VTLASAPEPRRLVRDVLLRDGWTLQLQTPTPVDYEDIKAFYDGLSADSRYLRFRGFGRTDTVARADAEAGDVDRLALLGRHEVAWWLSPAVTGCASRVWPRSRLQWPMMISAAGSGCGCSSSSRRSRRAVGSTASMRKWRPAIG
jgi:hypothetical protein